MPADGQGDSAGTRSHPREAGEPGQGGRIAGNPFASSYWFPERRTGTPRAGIGRRTPRGRPAPRAPRGAGRGAAPAPLGSRSPRPAHMVWGSPRRSSQDASSRPEKPGSSEAAGLPSWASTAASVGPGGGDPPAPVPPQLGLASLHTRAHTRTHARARTTSGSRIPPPPPDGAPARSLRAQGLRGAWGAWTPRGGGRFLPRPLRFHGSRRRPGGLLGTPRRPHPSMTGRGPGGQAAPGPHPALAHVALLGARRNPPATAKGLKTGAARSRATSELASPGKASTNH